jgi:hypothetical protein
MTTTVGIIYMELQYGGAGLEGEEHTVWERQTQLRQSAGQALPHGGVPVAADGGQVEAAVDGREAGHDLVKDIRGEL